MDFVHLFFLQIFIQYLQPHTTLGTEHIFLAYIQYLQRWYISLPLEFLIYTINYLFQFCVTWKCGNSLYAFSRSLNILNYMKDDSCSILVRPFFKLLQVINSHWMQFFTETHSCRLSSNLECRSFLHLLPCSLSSCVCCISDTLSPGSCRSHSFHGTQGYHS